MGRSASAVFNSRIRLSSTTISMRYPPVRPVCIARAEAPAGYTSVPPAPTPNRDNVRTPIRGVPGPGVCGPRWLRLSPEMSAGPDPIPHSVSRCLCGLCYINSLSALSRAVFSSGEPTLIRSLSVNRSLSKYRTRMLRDFRASYRPLAPPATAGGIVASTKFD